MDSGENRYFRRSEGLGSSLLIVDKPVDTVEKSIFSGVWRNLPTWKTLKEGFTPKVIPKCGARFAWGS